MFNIFYTFHNLITNLAEILDLSNLMGGKRIWMPVPDNEFTSESFLPGKPEQLLIDGQININEVLIGTNADEGLFSVYGFILNPNLWADFRENFDIIGPMELFNIANPSEITQKDIDNAHRIIEFYVGSVGNINENHMRGIIDMFSDAYFVYGTFNCVKLLLNQSVKVYQYVLSFEGQYSFSETFGIDPMGVSHADDLLYLWDPVFGRGELPFSEEEISIRGVMLM